MRMGDVVNLQTYKTQQADNGKTAAPAIGRPGDNAEASRPGENNSLHIATAILLVGILAVATGLVNARISVGR